MTNLKRASNELFRRSDDECFSSFDDLYAFCKEKKENGTDVRSRMEEVSVGNEGGELQLIANAQPFGLNSWSFGQLCQIARAEVKTMNRLSSGTARQVFSELLPRTSKPIDILATDQTVRSMHNASYTRIWDSELLSVVKEFATDFEPPQEGIDGRRGLYAGEQDCFAFLIDPLGWTEIDGEAFAPGFFVWNSEVGRRSIGFESFWFQALCQNHIVWDAIEVNAITRKHTANVHESLSDIRAGLDALVAKRDERKDGFVKAMRSAMSTKLGDDADEVLKVLSKNGITRKLAKEAMELAKKRGAFTVFALVDALTRIAGQTKYAGLRTEADQKASALLALAV